ncbi:M23 family metallopeptidase [Paramaledivibacter caminithermalis]|jgi:murein DD-endopeptidase MepM/ murein hydrolase activator NlpD|uniref:Murein DD-endopeptidase MepM and murein hydrolase activator NlpD, contain LysM domain n=1 Tax=Paramaledivibacter caminithermalis (strain DSM 15212 / CIP 107654 / DViRD3) TaxID=1121301 RepID=A0A1M6NC00_PARC5|nr:M23 family metallopeptidase [Paramaledivibacter caminithermalis]SHJ93268.1 Murein DD-endopeptidase MepM and murein hydrolase activator NlpD, contain LysM domain [Paramaledivibacter caminithermalis DSM 15212]
MINQEDFNKVKKNIKKYLDKIKNIKGSKILIASAIIISMLFITVFLTYDNKSKDNGLTSGIKVESFNVKNNSSNKKDLMEPKKIPKDIAGVKNDVDEILKVKIPVYTLNVNGEELAVLKTKSEAQKLLDDIVKPFIEGEEVRIEEVRFKEDVKITGRLGSLDEFEENREYEEVLHYITKGTSETKIHKVEKGENYWAIAQKYNIKPEDLIKANPGVKPETLQIGQEISLVVPKPLITVVTTEIKEYEENIAFETEYEDTNVLYKGEYRVKKAGEKGERQVKARIVKENGIETNRDILEENIIKNPITKVVLKGTKNPPPKIGTGKLAKPTSRGVLTSPFGMRWGRRHSGIDIGIPIGTDVKAADGGKVIFSGTKGGYGKCIIIDHGANVQTLYAHNSKLLVKKGTKVFKGQTIAKSGNTGRSTGPHLHFEVRKNGTPVNPAKYVKY